mgnify:CR=1 FL=1|jgi:NAD(P)-dependent dehydrogenase (short-subunit alcohol dehydrogenase family)
MTDVTNKKLMIISGATSTLGKLAIEKYRNIFDLLLLDIEINKLKKVQSQLAPNASILGFDITSTVSQSNLNKTLQKRDGFDYFLHFSEVGPDVLDISYIYKVNLIGTRVLFNTLYPHIHKDGVVINLSATSAYLTPIPAGVFPLLNDPLRKTFLDEIVPLTKDAALAYGWAKFGAACFTKRDSGKWGLKKASLINIFPDHTKSLNIANMSENCKELYQALQYNTGVPLSKEHLLTFIDDLLNSNKTLNGVNIILGNFENTPNGQEL